MRILITGSRDWPWPNAISMSLLGVAAGVEDDDITIVSGACPTGADAAAERTAERMGWKLETHPADWSAHGRRAGYVRNQAMVEAGADLCLAFIKDSSRGATMTVKLAEDAGIPVTVNRYEST